MRLRLAFLSLLALTASVAATEAQLHLVPVLSYRELAGIRFARLEFNGERQRITYEIPTGWHYSSSDRQLLKLYPKDAVQADAAIQMRELEAPSEITPEEAELLKAELLETIPKDSENIEVRAVEMNPLQVAGQNTCEVAATFSFFGQKFRTSVLFVRVGDAELRFKLSALETDFIRLQGRFRASLYSFQARILPAPKVMMMSPANIAASTM